MPLSRMKDTHVLDRDGIVLDETAWSTKDNDATVRSVTDDIVSDNTVGTAETDPVGPLLERVRAARADIVVPNHSPRAGECTFGDVKARPRAGVK